MAKTFKEINEPSNNLMVVDALNIAFRWKHSGATDFYEDYLRTINSLKKSYKAKYVVITADQGSSSYRKEIYPEYKGDRKEKYAEQTPAEEAAFKKFFEDYQFTIEYIKQETDYPILQYRKTEADDIAAYIVSMDLPVNHTWLISTDKDWHLLISDKVSQFSYVTRKEVTLNNWYDHHNCTPEQYISIKVLEGGDDNIKGIEKVGPKRALDLINQYGDAIELAANIPIDSKLKYMENVNKSKDLILLNYQLMDLESYCATALGDAAMQDIDTVLNQYIKEKS
jgi:DNA polymerase-1